MQYILPIVGIVGAFVMMIERERIGDMVGESKWIHDHGGIYSWVVIVAVFILLWSIAELLGVAHYVFWPIRSILPGEPNPFAPVYIP